VALIYGSLFYDFTKRDALSSLYKIFTAISIKVVHEQSGKVEYERERLLATALKIH
jgi:hypothetical protein